MSVDIAVLLSQFSEGTVLTCRATGKSFERTPEQDWVCRDTGQVYTDNELAEEFGEDLE